MKLRKFIYWAPRILGILFIIFISTFAFDVFSAEYSFFEITIALFMHLVPSFILLALLLLSWKREFAGGLLFLALGFISILFFNQQHRPQSFVMLSVPIFLIGLFFLLSGKAGKNGP